MNQTLIYLLPKVAPCNVIIKVMSKVIANHLQSMSDFQSSFIPGRATVDRVVNESSRVDPSRGCFEFVCLLVKYCLSSLVRVCLVIFFYCSSSSSSSFV